MKYRIKDILIRNYAENTRWKAVVSILSFFTPFFSVGVVVAIFKTDQYDMVYLFGAIVSICLALISVGLYKIRLERQRIKRVLSEGIVTEGKLLAPPERFSHEFYTIEYSFVDKNGNTQTRKVSPMFINTQKALKRISRKTFTLVYSTEEDIYLIIKPEKIFSDLLYY